MLEAGSHWRMKMPAWPSRPPGICLMNHQELVLAVGAVKGHLEGILRDAGLAQDDGGGALLDDARQDGRHRQAPAAMVVGPVEELGVLLRAVEAVEGDGTLGGGAPPAAVAACGQVADTPG